MTQNSAVAGLVRRARRRHIFQLIFEQLTLALAIGLGAAIVLLIVGTQFLEWWWIAAVFGAGLCAGAYGAVRNMLSRYAIARRLDHNLGLNDALSTALYFDEHPEHAKSPQDVVEAQAQLAGQAALNADLRRGIPFHFSRAAYVSGGLALVAVSVFGLRYGISRTLDLRPSLVRIAFDGFLPSQQVADARHKQNAPRPRDIANPATLKYDPWQAQAMDQKGAPDSALNTVDTPNVDNSNNTGPAADTKATGAPSKESADSSADNPENSEMSNGTPNPSQPGSQSASKDGNKASAPPPGAEQKSSNPGESSTLTDKMRDALANLLSKLKMQPKSGGNKSGGQQGSQNGSQQMAQNRQAPSQSGSPTPGKPQDAMASPDGQSNQDAQGTEQAKSGQGKSNGKGDDHSNSQDGKSGIGRQDGDKSIKEAEQLAAMGKISEIIGKRSQNVSGEVMVEVASGNQQLKTQYSQRKATHTDSGGEISRDEVPLAYQQYVQQYFEEIRKLPAAKAKPGKAGDAKKSSGSS